jgi:site-specific DNA recombinase
MAEQEMSPRRPTKKVRCAIYTRKSSDGGYSGGTMERPALQRLIADIEAGQIDVVVVYKVDRLTRALSDFAKIVEIFDHRGVSFVSITQQFNTTTSMGRLTLNVLLSFAQFEREVIGERVRDKIAASKRKGMWMGGMPPLGYDVKDRKLVVNDEEVPIVVDIYRRYLALKSVRALKEELAGAGIRSKRRVRPDGTVYGGAHITRGALYLMLQNRIYRGEITHRGKSYPGEHAAIIDRSLWDEVQTVLAKNRVERATGVNAKSPSLVAGFVFDATGERLTPSYAVKKGTRYRYYVSASLIRGARRGHSAGWRIPAGDLESLVINRLRAFFAEPTALLDVLDDESHTGSQQSELIECGRRIAEEIGALAPDKIKATLMTLLCRVVVDVDRIEINISQRRLAQMLAGQSGDLTTQDQRQERESHEIVTLTVPARLKRVGREMRMLVKSADNQTTVDPSLLRIIARAHDIQGRLSQNTGLTVHDIARQERVTAAYIYTLLRLPWLAPDITTAIVNGRQPQQLNAKTLMAEASRLPAHWAEQRTLLGF